MNSIQVVLSSLVYSRNLDLFLSPFRGGCFYGLRGSGELIEKGQETVKEKYYYMANLHVAGTFHQGDGRFSVQTRDKQCAFMSLSAVLTAQNIPVIDWSKTILDNVLLQGNKMYLKALNSGLTVLDPGIEFLSADNLPKVVSVSCCSNMFSYEIELPMDTVIADNIDNLPIMVEPFEAQNNPELSTVVENTELPVEVENTEIPVEVENTELPVEVENTELPVEVENTELPVEVENTELPVEVGNTQLPIVVENTVPEIVEHIDKNLIWVLNYEQELQGLLIKDSGELESHYYTIRSALLNTYMNHNYAIFTLDGYMMAIIKQLNYFYIFDSHARDLNGMPDPHGTAVVSKFTDVLELEQFLYSLSRKLHVNLFEIVPIYVTKTYLRLQKATEKTKHSEELEKKRQSKKQKRSNETDSERQVRLEKDRQSKKQKQGRKASQLPHEIHKQDYLNMFDVTKFGGIEEQCWAKANMNKFHKSVQYFEVNVQFVWRHGP